MSAESALSLSIKDSEVTLSFIADACSPAYGRCLFLFVLLLLAPALLTFIGGKLLRRRSMHYKPPWMCPAWASESDAYKLLFQEIYATQPIRLTRVVVGSGAIAMQSMVLLLVFWTLHGKMVFSRVSPDDRPVLAFMGRCVAFAVMTIKILQGDVRRDFKMSRFAATHPGDFLGNTCAFLVATLGATIGLVDIGLGAVLIVKAGDLISSMVAFAGYGLIMDIDNWFVNLFELDSHDLRWLDEESFAYLDINHDGVITPDEIARRIEEGGLSPAPTPSTTEATEASPFGRVPGSCGKEATGASPFKRLTGYFSKAPEPVTPETKPTPEPCNCLVALRLGIFFVVYPAVIAYLWFYYIPTRSIPK